MMQKFRIRVGSVAAGVVTVPPSSHDRPPARSTVPRGASPRPGWDAAPHAGNLAGRSADACRPDAPTDPFPPARHRGSRVANIKSQIKRNKTNEKARQRNVAVKSALKTAVRRFREAAATGDAAAATTALQTASKALDKAASKGVIHKNQAANRKSGMAKQLSGLSR